MANFLGFVRRQLNYTQADLAKKLNCTQANISKLENSVLEDLHHTQIEDYLNALNLSDSRVIMIDNKYIIKVKLDSRQIQDVPESWEPFFIALSTHEINFEKTLF